MPRPKPTVPPNEAAAGQDPGSFGARVLAWAAVSGRHDLPWQRDRSAYRVWVSEVMLQQTQVATVVPYFERFVARFPDVGALADAPLDAVLHHWSGLGYYARARNLHRAACLVRERHGGRMPRDLEALVELPGIGRSTAGAILALAHDERHPILDGNVKRVLARWGAIEGFPGEPRVANALWALSEAVTPKQQAAGYAQAIMDLGATLCTRTKPGCERCPVAADCEARRQDRVRDFPAARPARVRPQREVVWLVVRRKESVLLEQRPASGIWGGLWGFPEFADRTGAERALGDLAVSGAASRRVEVAPTITHAFSHFDLAITPLVVELERDSVRVMEGPAQTWYNSRAPEELGLAAPVATLLRSLGSGSAASAGRFHEETE